MDEPSQDGRKGMQRHNPPRGRQPLPTLRSEAPEYQLFKWYLVEYLLF